MVRHHFANEKCKWEVGLRKCIRPLLKNCLRAMTECAALCSLLTRQSCEDFFTPHVSRAHDWMESTGVCWIPLCQILETRCVGVRSRMKRFVRLSPTISTRALRSKPEFLSRLSIDSSMICESLNIHDSNSPRVTGMRRFILPSQNWNSTAALRDS